MLKISLFLVVLVALNWVHSLPVDKQEVRILRNEREDFEDGSYRFSYETSDGQKREEQSQVYEIEGEDPVVVITGSYSYIGPDGVQYTVEYTADQNGFRPQGAHLPEAEGETNPGTEEPVGLPANAINSLLG